MRKGEEREEGERREEGGRREEEGEMEEREVGVERGKRGISITDSL